MEGYLSSSYSWGLVALSYGIAVLASYAALDVAGKLRQSTGQSRAGWLLIGSVSMGVGVWSMHFIGMLALRLPLLVSYDPLITVGSGVAAVLAAAVAFLTISGKKLGVIRLLLAGIVMGSGIVVMHYGGMYAMQMAAHTSYDPLLFGISVGIAVAASIAAMVIAYQLSNNWATKRGSGFLFFMRFVAALIMGVAVCGMHYTGMAAARFSPTGQMVEMASVDTWLLGFAVVVSTFVILFTALMSTAVSRSFGSGSFASNAVE